MTPRRVVFFTFGKGSGDLVVGISLALAFRRAGLDCRFTAVTNNEFASVANGFIKHVAVPVEPHLFMVADRRTRLFRALRKLKPDLLIVYGSWVPVLPVIGEFSCKKVLLTRQVNPPFLRIPSPVGTGETPINPGDYDLALTCEPGFELPGFRPIQPIVIRNRDEILPRDEARRRLRVPDGKKLVVVARNGYEGELEELLARRGAAAGGSPSHDDNHGSEWHRLVTTNKDGGGIFPLADYANAIDLLVSGGGYSTFYECRYFGIPAALSAFERNAEDIGWRLRTNATYSFEENGADEFVSLAGGW